MLAVRKSTLSARNAVISFQERRSLSSSWPSSTRRETSSRFRGLPADGVSRCSLNRDVSIRPAVAKPWKSPCVPAERQKERRERGRLAPRQRSDELCVSICETSGWSSLGLIAIISRTFFYSSAFKSYTRLLLLIWITSSLCVYKIHEKS